MGFVVIQVSSSICIPRQAFPNIPLPSCNRYYIILHRFFKRASIVQPSFLVNIFQMDEISGKIGPLCEIYEMIYSLCGTRAKRETMKTAWFLHSYARGM